MNALLTHARRLVILSVLLALFACSVDGITRPETTDYDLKITDNSPSMSFDLVFQSHSASSLCLTIEQWPSRTGQLNTGSDLARVQFASGREIAARDENFGYCPGGCGQYRIPPHGELRGVIAYDAFDDPEVLKVAAQKKLLFLV